MATQVVEGVLSEKAGALQLQGQGNRTRDMGCCPSTEALPTPWPHGQHRGEVCWVRTQTGQL